MAEDWQFLPTTLLNTWGQQQKADDWAKDQTINVAQDWGDVQRSIPTPASTVPPPDAGVPAQASAVPPSPAPEQSPPPSAPVSGGGQFSPYDDTFRKYAGAYADDPEFIKIVASGTLAESSWNPSDTTGDGGHSWGLFQMHDHGAGAGMGNSRLDPDTASSVMVPKYAAGYALYKDKLSGPALAAAVAQYAERSADPTGSSYAAAYKTLGGPQQPNLLASAQQFVGNVAQNVPQVAAAGLGIPLDQAKQGAQDLGQFVVNTANTMRDSPFTPSNMLQSSEKQGLIARALDPNVSNEDLAMQAIVALSVGGGEGGGRPLFGRGGVPGADVGRNPLPAPTNPEDLTNALQQSQYQVLVNKIRDAGWSDDQIAASLKEQGVPDEQIQGILNPPPQVTVPSTRDDWRFSLPPTQEAQPAADVGQVGGQAPPPPTGPPPAPPGEPPPPTGPQGPTPTFDVSGQQMPTGVTPDTVAAAHARIDRALPIESNANYEAHQQLDDMLNSRAAPDEIARFLGGQIEGKSPDAMSVLRTVRTGAMAGGLSTEGKVALGPAIQVAMRAPVGALKAIVTGQPGDIATGMQGGLAGLAEGAADGLQTLRYGINYRSALTGGAQGGYGFAPGIDVMGSNPVTRGLGTLATGLVRTHGAVADVSAGIGRGANAALGASPDAAAEAGQQWALRSGQYGATGQAVSNALEGIRRTNPALDLVGQILVPFYRVGYNAFTQGVERSPVGLAGRVTDALQGKPLDQGKLMNNMFGVGLATIGFAQAANGNITGERPQGGAPKWSVRVGGQWVPLRTLGPAGESLAQSAALYEASRDNQGNVAQMAEQTASEYVNHVYDETWLRSIGDAISTISDVGNLASPSKSAQATAQRDLSYQGGSYLKSFIPQEKLGEQVLTGVGAGVPSLPGSSGSGGRTTRPRRG